MRLPSNYIGIIGTHRYRVIVEPIAPLEDTYYNYEVFQSDFQMIMDHHVFKLVDVNDLYLFVKIVEDGGGTNPRTANVKVSILFELIDDPSLKLPPDFQVNSSNGRYQVSVRREFPYRYGTEITMVVNKEDFQAKIKEYASMLPPDYNAFIKILLITYKEDICLYQTQEIKVNIELISAETLPEDINARVLDFRWFVDDLVQSGQLE